MEDESVPHDFEVSYDLGYNFWCAILWNFHIISSEK